MFTQPIFWLWLAGLVTLAVGVFTARKSVSRARGMEKAIALGPTFFAAPLALFGAEHLTSVQAISQVVPRWMPAHLFWTYLVGIALICAGLAIALNIRTRLVGTLLAIMFTCFVLMIHLPNAIANPHDRFTWAVALRDLSFGAGSLALAADGIRPARVAARLAIAIPLLFFAVEHFLHPQFAPGVPLPKVTPGWVPLRAFWGYLTGLGLLVCGGTMVVEARFARLAGALLGTLIALLVLFLYLPIFLAAPQAGLLEGINYVGDTLLFGGVVLLGAAIMPGQASASASTFSAVATKRS